MRIIFILSLILLLFSCTRTNRYFENFKFGQNAYISVSIKSCESSTHFEIYSRHTFPDYAFLYHVKINQDTNFIISLPSNLYDLSFIKIGNESYNDIYLIPNDTLHLILNLDSKLNHEEKINLEGATAEIYQYYEEKMKNWKRTNGYDYYYDSTISISKFAEKVNKNRDNDLKFLNEYSEKNNLPDWFVDIEKNSIIYHVAGQKLGILNYHWIYYDSSFNPPQDYYSFLDDIRINNTTAGLSDDYYSFLMLYFSRNFKPVKSGYNAIYHSNLTMIEELKSAKNKLDSRIRDILLGKSITTLYIDKFLTQTNITQTDTLFELAKPLFEDESLVKVVTDYRDSQFLKFQNQAALNPGDNAPGFHLSDNESRYFKLSDFKGKMIYVNFWATYCNPCIATIPDKNKLVNEFLDQPFELVNICLDYKPEKWKQIIEENNFLGAHLICKGDWRYTLCDNYLIQTIPHYVLIDKEGKIICNNCEKPDKIVAKLRSIFSLD